MTFVEDDEFEELDDVSAPPTEQAEVRRFQRPQPVREVPMDAEHEGIVPAPYRDSTGLWTYGIGHTAAAGAPGPSTRPSANVTVYMSPAFVPSFIGLATTVIWSPLLSVEGFQPWRDSVFGLPHSKLQSAS